MNVPSPNTTKNEEPLPVSVPITAQRFQTTDLQDKGMWMGRRLRERWPHVQEHYIRSWLGGLTAQNEFHFVHSKNAVLLAQRFIDGLDRDPTVRIWFVMVRDVNDIGQLDEAAQLYGVAEKWGIDIGAKRMIDLEKMTDVPSPVIKSSIGSRAKEETSLVAVLKK